MQCNANGMPHGHLRLMGKLQMQKIGRTNFKLTLLHRVPCCVCVRVCVLSPFFQRVPFLKLSFMCSYAYSRAHKHTQRERDAHGKQGNARMKISRDAWWLEIPPGWCWTQSTRTFCSASTSERKGNALEHSEEMDFCLFQWWNTMV